MQLAAVMTLLASTSALALRLVLLSFPARGGESQEDGRYPGSLPDRKSWHFAGVAYHGRQDKASVPGRPSAQHPGQPREELVQL